METGAGKKERVTYGELQLLTSPCSLASFSFVPCTLETQSWNFTSTIPPTDKFEIDNAENLLLCYWLLWTRGMSITERLLHCCSICSKIMLEENSFANWPVKAQYIRDWCNLSSVRKNWAFCGCLSALGNWKLHQRHTLRKSLRIRKSPYSIQGQYSNSTGF